MMKVLTLANTSPSSTETDANASFLKFQTNRTFHDTFRSRWFVQRPKFVCLYMSVESARKLGAGETNYASNFRYGSNYFFVRIVEFRTVI